jgi:hypothetical protein
MTKLRDESAEALDGRENTTDDGEKQYVFFSFGMPEVRERCAAPCNADRGSPPVLAGCKLARRA